MNDDPMDREGMSPRKKPESPRGRYPIATALHYALQQISRFPEVRRSDRDCDDMRAILNGCFPEMAAEFRANDRRWGEIHKPKAVDAGFHPLGGGDGEE